MSDHTKDVQDIHDGIAAAGELFASINAADMSHVDWLEALRGVREKVKTFALFVPNADRIEHMLDVAERIALAVLAAQRIAKKV